MKQEMPRWWGLQSGQAMMEYWPTIPVAIMIMVAASLIATAVNKAFLQTSNELNRAGLDQAVCDTPEEEDSGPTFAQLGDHTIKLVANSYDPNTNTTVLSYQVTSGSQPSISHWVLGLPISIANEIDEANEAYEWTNDDPTTHIAGIKFDTGYEGGDGGGGGKGGGKKAESSGDQVARVIRFSSPRKPASYYLLDTATGESRTISLMLTGQYDFASVTVTIKAGTETYSSSISAPVAVFVENSDALNADNLYEGCQ